MATAWPIRVEGETRAPDLGEVRRALEVIADPRNGVELMSLFPPRHMAYRGEDLEAMVADVAAHQGSNGNFVSPNPLPPGFKSAEGAGARVADFVKRRWLVLDFDPVKPAKDCNASEAEREAVRAVMTAATGFLAGQGWPDPVLIDSGGGWLALYRVDLPNDQLTRALFKRLLVALAGAFDTAGATIDVGAAKVTVHARLPGTWNRKGPHQPDRPHRMVQLARVPAEVRCVSLEQIREAAGIEPEERARPKKRTRLRVRATGGGEEAYVKKALAARRPE
jgi:hypothetical protein